MKWRNSKERELLATGTGSRDQTLPNKNNPNPDLSDTVCDRNQSVSPGSTSSTHSDVKTLATTSGDPRDDNTPAAGPTPDKELRNADGMYGHAAESAAAVPTASGGSPSSAMQTSFLANIYNGKLGYPSMKSHTYKVSGGTAAATDYDDSSDSSMNSDEEINVT